MSSTRLLTTFSALAAVTSHLAAAAEEVAEADTSPTVHEAILDAPPAEVWKVWTTAEGFTALGVAKAEIDLRVGGLIRSHYRPEGVLGDEGTIQNRIIAYEPERMLAIRIDKPPRGFPFPGAWQSTWSVITLTDLGDGRTHVRLAGMGYTAESESQAMRKFFLQGNDWSLKKLASHFDARRAAEVPARAHADLPLAPVEAAVVVAGSQTDVWSALTTTKGWKERLGLGATIELRPGGAFEIHFKPEAPAGQRGSETCTMLSHDPLRMLSFTWNAPPEFPRARGMHTWVVLRLEPVSAAATRVHIKHLGFAEAAVTAPDLRGELVQVREHFTQAWPRLLGRLKRGFEAKPEDGGKSGG